VALHQIDSTPDTVHSFFSPELAPILTVAPGDRVRFSCLDAGFGLENRPADGSPRRELTPTRTGRFGHCLCGPIQIEGAQPGMELAVKVEAIRPGAWGWTLAHGLPPEGVLHLWDIDADAGVARNQLGHQVRLKPFMGVMGITPAEPGQHSTVPPRAEGGNLDCKELGVGSTLYLPIAVEGANFSVGDGHAVQGDGEVSGMALECPMEVELSFHLEPGSGWRMPRARTTHSWLTFGVHPQLTVATQLALDGMLHLIERKFQVSRPDALAMASVAVDLRITQIVNQSVGVHAVLEDGALEKIA
jgi:acetamidase/formamidase